MSRDQFTVSDEMDHALANVQCYGPDELDAARTMLAAIARLGQLNDQLRRNPVDPQLGRQLVEALLPGGFYLNAETQLARALGFDHVERAWTRDDFRALCTHILREGDHG